MTLQTEPMMPSFVYVTISGLMSLALMKTYKLKLPYILNEKANFRERFYLTDARLLFSKMQVKPVKSQDEVDVFQN